MTAADYTDQLKSPIKLAPGKLIEADGVYDIDLSTHHSQCCIGPSTSSSELRTIWRQSPAHAYLTSSMNPSNYQVIEVDGQKVRVRKDQGDRPHFALGRAAHHLLYLGEKGFREEFAVRPDKWSDWRTNDAKQWRKDAIEAGLTILTDAELEAITGMAKSLGAHPLVKAGIMDGYVERSLVWREPYTGVWLKSRPDSIPNASGDAVDLKGCQSVATEDLQRSIAKFDYQGQAGLVGMGFDAVLKRPMESFTLVFVEFKEPFATRIVTLPPEDVKRGEQQMRAATDTFAECAKADQWPGPGGEQEDAEFLGLPSWARKQIDARLEGLNEADADGYDPSAEDDE